MCPSFCNRHRGANGFERCSALFGQTLPIQLDGALVECSACCNSSCRSQIIFSFDLRNGMKSWNVILGKRLNLERRWMEFETCVDGIDWINLWRQDEAKEREKNKRVSFSHIHDMIKTARNWNTNKISEKHSTLINPAGNSSSISSTSFQNFPAISETQRLAPTNAHVSLVAQRILLRFVSPCI